MNLDEMRRRKEEKGYSNEMIAELSGVPLSTVQKIFSGITKRPRFDTIMALENVLGEASVIAETTASYVSKRQGEYTVADYYQIPNERRVELIDGVIYDMTAPGTVHQRLVTSIWKRIDKYIEINGGDCIPFVSPVDVHFSR